MSSRRAHVTVTLLCAVTAMLAALAPGRAHAQGLPGGPRESGLPSMQNLPELEHIEIIDRRGADIPHELHFTDQDGKPVRLGDYLDGKKPAIVVLAYYDCPMLCTVVLNGLLDGMKALDFTAGKDYRVVVVSFDTRDDVAKAAEKRQVYLAAYGRDPGVRGWDFLVGDEAQVRALADAVGFPYRWDPKTKQFAHSAGAFLLTPGGRLSQTLYGIQFPTRDLRFALLQASDGKLGSTWDRVLLRCFHWDPNAKGYRLAAYQLMKLGGLLTVVILSIVLMNFFRLERKRRPPPTEPVNVART